MATTTWLDSFGTGTLGRITATVYRTLILEALFLATAAPGILLILTLSPDPSNIPLVALGLLPAGPALSATVFAWRASRAESTLEPARHFWRGYRLNALAVLRWWWLVLVVGAVLSLNLAYLDAVVPDPALRTIVLVVQVLLLGGLAALSLNALVISSLFTFRAIDTLRLAARFLRRTPRVTIASIALTIAAVGIMTVGTEIAILAFAAPIAALLLITAQPLITDIEENFVS